MPKHKSDPGFRDLDDAVHNAAQKALQQQGPGAYRIDEIIINVEQGGGGGGAAGGAPGKKTNPLRDYIVTIARP